MLNSVMFYHVVLFYVVLQHTIARYSISYHDIFYYIILCWTMLGSTMLHCIMLCYANRMAAMLHHSIRHYPMLYHYTKYYAVRYYGKSNDTTVYYAYTRGRMLNARPWEPREHLERGREAWQPLLGRLCTDSVLGRNQAYQRLITPWSQSSRILCLFENRLHVCKWGYQSWEPNETLTSWQTLRQSLQI